MIPDYESIMLPLLEYAGDKREHLTRDATERLADYFKLTDEERRERLSSGQAIFYIRFCWAKTYLKNAGLLASTMRGYFRITNRGLQVLEEKPKKIDKEFLRKYQNFVEFIEGSNTSPRSDAPSTTMTVVDAAYRVLKDNEAPMHYMAITQQALNKGYIEKRGKTPEQTMSARLSSEIKKKGTKSRFIKVGSGTYGLSEWEKKPGKPKTKEQVSELDHDELILHLLELGEINGFKVDTGYSCDAYRLDAVWLAEYSDVPKYCFEVHISGSLHKDIAALKHAYDKWNSKIFLICTGEDLKVCERLISGSFHEIANRIKIIDAKEFFEYCQFKEKFKEINGLFG